MRQNIAWLTSKEKRICIRLKEIKEKSYTTWETELKKELWSRSKQRNHNLPKNKLSQKDIREVGAK